MDMDVSVCVCVSGVYTTMRQKRPTMRHKRPTMRIYQMHVDWRMNACVFVDR